MPKFINKDNPLLGFDPVPISNGKFPFQMVPKGGARGLWLLDAPKHNVVLVPTAVGAAGDGGFVEVGGSLPNKREIWVNGLKEGGMILAAMNPATGLAEARVEIGIMEERKRKVGFYIVKDSAGRKSKFFTAAKALDMLSTAHSIIYNQANLKLESAFNPEEDFDAGSDLGDTPMVNPTLEKMGKLITRAKADFHVFLIWKMEDEALSIHGMTPLGVTNGDVCLIKDTDKDVGLILAHETGHCFGLFSHNEKESQNLMFKTALNGKLLNKQQMLKVNQYASP